jgi:hypothetical protein
MKQLLGRPFAQLLACQLMLQALVVVLLAAGPLNLLVQSSAGASSPAKVAAVANDKLLVAGWKRALLEWGQQIPDVAERAQFAFDINAFEQRAKAANLSSYVIGATYWHVCELLGENKTAKVSSADRIKLAMQVMHQAADPTSIDQGRHNTCASTSLEKRVYSRDPNCAADAIMQIATTGSYKAADGVVVRFDELGDPSLTPDWEAAVFRVNKANTDASRSYASQLFQVMAGKLFLQERSKKLRYEQHPNPDDSADTGTRLVNLSTGAVSKVTMSEFSPALMDCDKMYYLVTGKHDTKFSILGKPSADSTLYFSAPGAYTVTTAAKLKEALIEIQTEGRMPAVVMVQSKNEPLLSDAPNSESVWHEMTIVWFDASTGNVYLDNQWGRAKDHLGRPDGLACVHYTVLFKGIINAANAR